MPVTNIINLQFRTNQNSFTLTLSSVTIGTAESEGLGLFINSENINTPSRAIAGMLSLILILCSWIPTFGHKYANFTSLTSRMCGVYVLCHFVHMESAFLLSELQVTS